MTEFYSYAKSNILYFFDDEIHCIGFTAGGKYSILLCLSRWSVCLSCNRFVQCKAKILAGLFSLSLSIVYLLQKDFLWPLVLVVEWSPSLYKSSPNRLDTHIPG